jgi:hypothetical protein
MCLTTMQWPLLMDRKKMQIWHEVAFCALRGHSSHSLGLLCLTWLWDIWTGHELASSIRAETRRLFWGPLCHLFVSTELSLSSVAPDLILLKLVLLSKPHCYSIEQPHGCSKGVGGRGLTPQVQRCSLCLAVSIPSAGQRELPRC